jgi:hypothetical protein
MSLRSPVGDEKWGHIVSILLGPPFPLMGKAGDRGAREPIKPITFPIEGKELTTATHFENSRIPKFPRFASVNDLN